MADHKEVLRKVVLKNLTRAMDRTNWEARGNDVNILVQSVCLGDSHVDGEGMAQAVPFFSY